MLSQRLVLGAARRIPTQVRQPVQRRLASTQQFTGAQDNAFNRERAAVKAHAGESADLWRKLSIYVAGPLLIIFAANAWTLWNEHWEHEKHRPAPADRPQYDYLNIRNKAYPWGDGDKTLFWNDKVNYKKTGE